MSQLSFPLCPFYLRSPLMGHGCDLTHRFAWSSMSPAANKLLSFSFIIIIMIIKRSHHCQIVQTTTVVVISVAYNYLSLIIGQHNILVDLLLQHYTLFLTSSKQLLDL